MDDIKKINDFLSLIANACKTGEKINPNIVYSNLIYYNIGKKRELISSNFKIWENYYDGKKNIFCFNPSFKKYFCFFVNSNGEEDKVENYIKLYISLDKEHIQHGAIKIFDFLTAENISHESKIGSHVRIDDIVIRVNSIENAEKIINYINSDKYIIEGAQKGSPFAIKDGIVSIAWDGILSYNMVVSSWISQYINWELNNSNLNNVNYSRFYSYIDMTLTNILSNEQESKKMFAYLEKEGIIKASKDITTKEQLQNYFDVTKLLIKSISTEKSKQEIYKFILQKKSAKKNEKIEQTNLEIEMYDERKMSELTEYMKLAFTSMTEKYGYEGTKARFIHFLTTGNYNCISRHKNAREIMEKNGINNLVAKKIVNNWYLKALDDAINATYQKYGYTQANVALNNLLKYKNFSYFTNEFNSRKILMERLTDRNIISIIAEKLKNDNYDISKMSYETLSELYLEKVLQKNKKNI